MSQVSRNNSPGPMGLPKPERIQPLDNGHKTEVMNFLAAHPLRTFIMTSFINDNGLVSSFNRGTFYGYRAAQSRLEGVALIGDITLFETENDRALGAFAAAR